MSMFSGVMPALEDALQYASAKNRAISENIANVDTPGYKKKDVEFKNMLQQELTSSSEAKRTHSKHKSFQKHTDPSFRIKTRSNTMYNHNGNNVDIDEEMAALAKNQIYYQALVDRLDGKFSSLKTVIGGGN